MTATLRFPNTPKYLVPLLPLRPPNYKQWETPLSSDSSSALRVHPNRLTRVPEASKKFLKRWEYVTKYIIVRATCGSDRSSEVRVVESELLVGTLHAFTVARHTELSKRGYLSVCLFCARVRPRFSSVRRCTADLSVETSQKMFDESKFFGYFGAGSLHATDGHQRVWAPSCVRYDSWTAFLYEVPGAGVVLAIQAWEERLHFKLQ